jgi:hypothetical protein
MKMTKPTTHGATKKYPSRVRWNERDIRRAERFVVALRSVFDRRTGRLIRIPCSLLVLGPRSAAGLPP